MPGSRFSPLSTKGSSPSHDDGGGGDDDEVEDDAQISSIKMMMIRKKNHKFEHYCFKFYLRPFEFHFEHK